MDNNRLAQSIRQEATNLGFERVGFCDVTPPAESRYFETWIREGMHGSMHWMETGMEKRLDPRLVLEEARSMVVVGLTYAPPSAGLNIAPGQELEGRVARYARGDDYHEVMRKKLARIEHLIEKEAPGHRALCYVDTGPILERQWAARAGIGWIGKNSLVLNKDLGSWFFLGVVITTASLPASAPATDQCGTCSLCIEACPTGAIVSPRVVDSRLCISFHTIELRGEIPAEFHGALGDRVFGCDDCQDACPWNRQEQSDSTDGHFPPRKGSAAPSLLELLTLSHEDYLERFRGSAIKRATWKGLRRNAAVALGNVPAGMPASEAVTALERVAADDKDDATVREHARLSAGKIRRR